jgi:hypothetical protein
MSEIMFSILRNGAKLGKQAGRQGEKKNVPFSTLNEKGDDGWLITNAIIVVSIDDGK